MDQPAVNQTVPSRAGTAAGVPSPTDIARVQNLFLVADAARRISRLQRGEHDDPVLRSDVDAVRGGTTKEGIRVGVMAGTLDILQRYYAGARIGDEVLYFDPQLLGGLGG